MFYVLFVTNVLFLQWICLLICNGTEENSFQVEGPNHTQYTAGTDLPVFLRGFKGA